MTEQFLTVEEAASRLHITGKTVRNLITRGRFAGAYRIDPSSIKSPWRIPLSDIELHEQRQRGWEHESIPAA